jgi:hypothetical protein
MNSRLVCLTLLFSILFLNGCALDTGGSFHMVDDADASLIPDQVSNQDALDSDAGPWPETGTPDADASTDVAPDSPPDSPPDAAPDVLEDVAPEADAPEDSPLDVVEEDSPLDVIEEDSPLDSPVEAPLDAPEDVIEADAPNPVECLDLGVFTENGKVMICASLLGGTGKSLMLKAEIISTVSSQNIPFKSVCWSEVGVSELACFPCPGAGSCWPQPDGGLPHASISPGDVIKFQPGIAELQGNDMQNTLCDLGACQSGRYIVYSGNTEVCRVNPNGTREGNATYEGSGTNVKIVCTL